MQRKIISIIAAIVLASTVLTGCSEEKKTDTSNNTSETTTVSQTGDGVTAEISADTTATPQVTEVQIVKEGDYYTIHDATFKLGEFNYKTSLDKSTFTCTESECMDYLNYRINSDLAKYNTITTGTVQNGDTLVISYVGTKKSDGSEFANDTNVDLTIGSGTFIPGFEEGLVGKEIGSKVTLDLTFPDDYYAEEMRSAETTFTIDIISKKEVIPQEINDDFIAENFDFNTFDEFYEDYKKTEIDEKYNKAKIDEAFAYITEYAKTCDFTKDTSMYAEEIYANNIEMYNYYASMYGVDYETYVTTIAGVSDIGEFEKIELANANEQADRLVIITALADANKIEVTEDMLKEYIGYYVEAYGYAGQQKDTQVEELLKDEQFKTSFKETSIQIAVLEKLFDIPPQMVFYY